MKKTIKTHIIYWLIITLLTSIFSYIQFETNKKINIIKTDLVFVQDNIKKIWEEKEELDQEWLNELIQSAIIQVNDRIETVIKVFDSNVEIYNQEIAENRKLINEIIDYLN